MSDADAGPARGLELILPDDRVRLVDRLVADATGRRLVVLLDGGSGAGKTTLARDLVAELSARLGRLVQLVSLDDAYPGWYGLAQASDWVWQTILRPDAPGHPTWDWVAGRPAGWVSLDGAAPIIVEGCGALTSRSAALASTTLWYERDAATRHRLAMDRDGDGYRPWWDAWAAQEAAHWTRNQPRSLADVVLRESVDGESARA